jgi:opacity protein-like surface antigen
MRYALRVGVCAAAMLAAPFAAGAADVPIVPPAAAVAPWSWSGLYAGFHVANGWANDTWRSGSGAILDNPLFAQLFVPFIGSASGSGAVAGGQVGYNYQIGSWVFGVEAALSAADINSNMPCAQALFSCNASVDGLGTLTGRAGFAFDQFLVYAKGGAAGQHVHYNMVLIPLAGLANVLHGSESRTGWTAGVGVEFALSPALSAVAEYDYLDFGTHVAALIDQNGNAAHVTTSQSTHLVKVGLNYKIGEPFGWAASAKAVPIFLPPPPASQNWTGVYVGANVGGGWGQTNWNSSTGVLGAFSDSVFAASGTANGFVVGGQIGANYQIGPWVMGVEADAGWADIDGNARCATSSAIVTSFTCHTRIDSLGTVTGRFGETFGNLLVYGKGGAAWDREEHTAVQGLSSPTTIFSGDATRWGWAIGAGLEYAFTPAWSGKVEYDYLSFGNAGVGTSDGFGHSSTIGISQGLSVVKMGFNYKLGADPAAGYGAAAPVPIWVKAPVFKAPPPSDWTIEAGARYWVSGGRKQLDLFAAQPPNQLNSRLTFAGVVGQSAEAFARLDHRNGMFLKGNFGLGDQVKGQFYDEDFAPFTLNAGAPPYSNTVSSQRDGRMLYGSLDVGHEVIAGPAGDLGAYVGYRYLYERNNAFGFVQLAAVEFPTESTVLGISETEAWSGAAIGVNARMQLAERWRLEVDAAYLPFVGLTATDNHWFRANINPLSEQGQGWGSQFEAILSYALTDQWSIGAGGRYWYFATTSAHTQFPVTPFNSPIRYYSERYGGFLQATYKFDGGARTSAAARAESTAPAPVNWTGFYVGGHLGAGFGRSNWSDPFGPTSIGDQDRVGGALAGGQVGYNYQIGIVVTGVEASGSWSQLTGTESCFAGNPNQGNAGLDCGTNVGALATLTGRVGLSVDRTLYYAKAGPAWGHTTFMLNAGGAAPGLLAVPDADRWGFTVGAGVEHALTRQWSIAADYKYVDLGTATVGFASLPAAIAPVAIETINQRYHVLTLGMNYKLN